MPKIRICLSIVALGASAFAFASAQTSSALPQATLYSPNKYKTERRVSCINFQIGSSESRSAHCDLSYGNLWAGDDLDWFQSASAEGDRSVIKDLGKHDWIAEFEIPI